MKAIRLICALRTLVGRLENSEPVSIAVRDWKATSASDIPVAGISPARILSACAIRALGEAADVISDLDSTLTHALELSRLFVAAGVWGDSVFGKDRGPQGALNHLKKEIGEALDNPADITEYVDLLMLAFDAARCAGFTFDQLVEAYAAKLEVNKARKWGKPGPDGVVEHVREGRAGQ